ncbi:MAG: fused MFS/spermidine synthase, partial [Flavobacteriales bacterium]|nr:fused MFS/spermidine synthase [Flavobacteriales bacterium]
MISSNKLLFVLAFIEGATVLAIELLSARMLAPYFGSGIQVWGAVIGVTVASLAIGYYLGGLLCQKGVDRQKLLLIFLLSSA